MIINPKHECPKNCFHRKSLDHNMFNETDIKIDNITGQLTINRSEEIFKVLLSYFNFIMKHYRCHKRCGKKFFKSFPVYVVIRMQQSSNIVLHTHATITASGNPCLESVGVQMKDT